MIHNQKTQISQKPTWVGSWWRERKRFSKRTVTQKVWRCAFTHRTGVWFQIKWQRMKMNSPVNEQHRRSSVHTPMPYSPNTVKKEFQAKIPGFIAVFMTAETNLPLFRVSFHGFFSLLDSNEQPVTFSAARGFNSVCEWVRAGSAAELLPASAAGAWSPAPFSRRHSGRGVWGDPLQGRTCGFY